MRRLIVILLVGLALQCQAQQLPIYSHYNFNLLGINPATAGSQSCLNLRLGLRRQWVGIPGAPESAYMGAQGSFGKKRHSFHGAGVHVETDEAGPIRFTSLNGIYAYHTRVNHKNMFSAGLSIGFSQSGINGGILNPNVSSALDPALPGNVSEFLFPQIGLGLWLQSEKRYVGLSVKNTVENTLESVGPENQSKFRRHFFLTAGRVISLEKKLFFKPSVNFRYVGGAPIALDFTAVFDYNDSIEAGLAFRGGHGISGLLKINLLKYLTVGYAYDLTLNKLRFGSRNSHEVILGIQACSRGKNKRIRCSAYD